MNKKEQYDLNTTLTSNHAMLCLNDSNKTHVTALVMCLCVMRLIQGLHQTIGCKHTLMKTSPAAAASMWRAAVTVGASSSAAKSGKKFKIHRHLHAHCAYACTCVSTESCPPPPPPSRHCCHHPSLPPTSAPASSPATPWCVGGEVSLKRINTPFNSPLISSMASLN